MKQREYRYLAASIEGLVQQVAVSYLRHGYLWYVSGWIPPEKDPLKTDKRFFEKYEVRLSRWARQSMTEGGEAVQHYLRHDRFWVLLSRPGKGRFFREEKGRRNFKRHALRYGMYQISYRLGHDRKWHAHVAISDEEYRNLTAMALQYARHRQAAFMESFFWNLPYAPYAPIRRQVWTVWRKVQRVRKAAGFEPISKHCVRCGRKRIKPFAEEADLYLREAA